MKGLRDLVHRLLSHHELGMSAIACVPCQRHGRRTGLCRSAAIPEQLAPPLVLYMMQQPEAAAPKC